MLQWRIAVLTSPSGPFPWANTLERHRGWYPVSALSWDELAVLARMKRQSAHLVDRRCPHPEPQIQMRGKHGGNDRAGRSQAAHLSIIDVTTALARELR